VEFELELEWGSMGLMVSMGLRLPRMAESMEYSPLVASEPNVT
jgi:hypothetical protein